MSELHLVRASPRRIEVRDATGDEPDAASAAQFVYLGRQPILDRQGALNAYELLFRAGAHNYAEVTNDAQATAQVVARALGGIGVPAVLGQHRGFVNIDRTMLFDDIVHVMPPERFVLEILETVRFDAQLARRLGELRRGGFQVALDDVTQLSDELLAMLPHADIVKIDFLQTQRADLPELAAAMRGAGKTLIAEKVETREDFALARDLGFDLFQGYFFARPQVLAAPKNRSPRPGLMRLLALLSRDAGIVELEAELKLNPSVVVQLLRLVNSSAFGLGRNIASLREAIIATGTRQIARWAQLLLYADSGDLPWRADPLVQLAGTRSRFMELAAGWMRPSDDEFADAAFMTGIFSLVHVLLGSTPKAVLEKLGLAPQIRDAIVERRGALGMLLRIAEAAGEGADAASIARDCDAPPEFAALTPEILAELNLSAAAWFGAHIEEAAA
ncbi:EAL domain-containing protein [bacterium M00.F.Ca.ET.228.01.1.1]|uniref:Diguanylate phosphodiesterase n=1 Tax=Burkholderia sp. (strain CCGE1003) TaxID=640512 RepID=E1TBV5_BURSG|nr:EAL domain-containing protein [Paraburkholderia phenoliruptrix]TGP41286.1 EAL domain-containing protein [bacterium M00.F.Ca.ET.228.01.1.1]TGR97831.1 EAL domain-containing protein [bacterium M00.F.Ca.ET.191.01.1.1]TGU02000.1 EAL domain-containing protein [bacterium M00.F.Ca.ET.155.01.1.1]MBW0450514.1 EAL domain-containing protein [Paraburkholderia phenoliruptrix]MBW9098762.1 EAL domain-containing protein [Paraburkholderia phenoliruptrix]